LNRPAFGVLALDLVLPGSPSQSTFAVVRQRDRPQTLLVQPDQLDAQLLPVADLDHHAVAVPIRLVVRLLVLLC
jgi:hypothetical protein